MRTGRHLHLVSKRSQKWKTVFREVPLPLGEGAAKRRGRAKNRPPSGPSGHLLPKGEGFAQSFRRILDSSAREERYSPVVPVRLQLAIPSLIFTLIWTCLSIEAFSQSPEALFQARCAQSHTANNTVNAPLPETLRAMSWQSILAALETGKMKGIGDALTGSEREAISKHVGTDNAAGMPATAKCSARPRSRPGTDWNGWSDAANARFQPVRAAGLTSQTTPNLRLKWAFGFPGVTTAFGTPTVADGRVFVGAADGTVYSLDAHSGCVYWSFGAVSGVRVSPVVANGSVYFGDLR